MQYDMKRFFFKKSHFNFAFYRIFDSKKVKDVHNNKEWLDTTCNHTLFRMTAAFTLFFVKLAPILLTDLLSQFEWCLLEDNDQLAKSAASNLEELVLNNRSKMDSQTEHTILKFLSELITNTLMPNNLVETSKPLVPTSTSIKSLKHRINVHLEVIASIRKMIFGVTMKHSKTTLVANDSFRVRNCFKKVTLY